MTDERDPKVSQRYREMGAEEPPRALDEKILAASRRAVDAHPAPLVAPTGRRRWYFPVAAAAVIMLAAALTVQMERQKPDEEFVASAQLRKEAELRTAPAAPEPAKPAAAPKQKPSPDRERQFTPDPPAASPRADEAPRDLAKSNQATPPSEGTGLRERRENANVGIRGSGVAADEIAPQPAPAPAPARRAMEAPPSATAQAPAPELRQSAPAPDARTAGVLASRVERTPERWLDEIAELRKQGKHEEADKALAEFRQRYPDYRMSDEVKAKVDKK